MTKKGDQEKISTTLSSEWENGNTGPLRTLEPLDVQLVRDETQMLVQAEYVPEPTNTDDVFNAFQSMRILYYQQHPELGPYPYLLLDAPRRGELLSPTLHSPHVPTPLVKTRH